MGTRADFYVGRGEQAKWLGSIAWDGYPEGITPHGVDRWPPKGHLFDAKTEPTFKKRLARFFEGREDVTLPAQGWPWPWDTSSTTDYAYAFDGGTVYASCFGGKWYRAHDKRINEDESGDKVAVFPNMKDRQNVQLYGKRSGLIVIGV